MFKARHRRRRVTTEQAGASVHPAHPGSPAGPRPAYGTTRRSKVLSLLAVMLLLITGFGGASVANASPQDGYGAGGLIGANWFGTYQSSNGILGGCIDPGRADPSDLRRAGVSSSYQITSTVNGPTAGYIAYRYANTTDPHMGRAVTYFAQRSGELPHRGTAPPEFADFGGDNQARADYNQIVAEANNNRGPYRVQVVITPQPSATNGTGQVRLQVLSAAGFAQTNVVLNLSGASGLPATASTGASGVVTINFTANNSQSGTITAQARTLPSVAASIATAPGYPNDGSQRLIVTGPPSSQQGAAAYARPAAPVSYIRIAKRDATSGVNLAGANFRVVNPATGAVLATGTTSTSGVFDTGALNVAPGTTVQVVETTAPAGYRIDTASKNITTSATGGANRNAVVFTDTKNVPKSYIRVGKRDSAGGANLAGANFRIVNITTGAVLATGTSSASGVFDSPALAVAPGTTVRVDETQPPAGYTVETASKNITT